MSKLDVAEIAAKYLSRIHRAALVLCGDPWDAEDLVQETFLTFASRLERFEGRSNVYTWLYGILLNLERRERRRKSMRRRKLSTVWLTRKDGRTSWPPAEARMEAAEWKASLWAYVARLPDGQRQCLVLRYSEELTYEEIAQILDCPLGTVKSRIFHGLRALREMLDREHSSLPAPAFPLEDIRYVG